MNLADFMRDRGISDQEMAALVGCSEFAVRKWKYGERVPRGQAMSRLREATDGTVTANDFLPARPAPSEEAAA
jgi:predicted transcriptional regulator